MRLLRRRTEGPAEVDADKSVVTAADSSDPRRPTGKGRPTPRRREAQKRRSGPVAPPPRTRREAYQRMRSQGAERRAETREGVRSGDERFLLSRDRGEERRLVRDVVDSRRNAGALFIPAAVIYFVGALIPNTTIRAAVSSLWLTVLILFVADETFLAVKIRSAVRRRFPDSTEKMGRLLFYGLTRATLYRRWRSPKPAVPVGVQV